MMQHELAEWNAVLGHELRSPIAAILGYQELIAEGTFGDFPDGAREALDRIGLAAQQLLVLVEAIERSTSAPQPGLASTLVAAELCRDAIEHVRFEAEARGTTIEVANADVPLRTRRDDACRALVLILGAAIKVSPGETLRVFAADAGTPRITVAGAGLDPVRDTAAPAVPLTGAAVRLELARTSARHAGGSIDLDSSGSVHLLLPHQP